MILGGRDKGWTLYLGRDLERDARFMVGIAIGFLPYAAPGEIRWRRIWRWSSASLPGLVYRQFRWKGLRITLPIGYCAFGRWHVLM